MGLAVDFLKLIGIFVAGGAIFAYMDRLNQRDADRRNANKKTPRP